MTKNRLSYFRSGVLLLLTVLTFGLRSQTGVNSDIYTAPDRVITNFMHRWNIKGGAVAITQNGRLVYNRGFGFSDNGQTKTTRPHDLFRIASVSKPITSIAIMKLVEEGKLDLDEPVFGKGKLLDVPYYSQVIDDERIFQITARELLEHTAGWERQSHFLNYSSCDPPFFPLLVTQMEEAPNPVGDSTLIRFSLKKGLDYAPGTKYAYSNVGYLILGKLIEKASGLAYDTYIEKNIFQPLHIADLHLGKNLPEARQERETEYIASQTMPSCYGTGAIVPSQYGGWNIEAMNAHGGWISSASELCRLMLAVDGFSTSPDILGSDAIGQMTHPSAANNNYAKGWFVNGRNNWWHTGSLDGTSSFVCRTADGLTFAFLFNSRSDNSNNFWQALDKLPWDVLKAAGTFPGYNLFAPDENVKDLKAEVLAAGTVSLSWSKGSGDGRLVVVSEEPALNNFPEDGLSYLGNNAFGQGSMLDRNAFVVYNSYGLSTVVTGLTPGKAYYVTAFEYYINRNTGFYEVYKLGSRDRIMFVPDAVPLPSF